MRASSFFCASSMRLATLDRSAPVAALPARTYQARACREMILSLRILKELARNHQPSATVSWALVSAGWARSFWASFFKAGRSEEHTSELQSLRHLVCRL